MDTPAASDSRPVTAPVDIRRYGTLEHFQADAAVMARAGWHVAAQSERTVSDAGRAPLAAVLFVMLGLFLWWFWLLALVAVVVAVTSKRHEIVVTYQYRT